MKTIFSKLIFVFLVIIISLSLIDIAISLAVIKRYYTATFEDQLESMSAFLESEVLEYHLSGKQEELTQKITVEGRRAKIRITVIGIDGVVIADSEKDAKTMENHLQREEIQRALFGDKGKSIRYSSTVKNMMLYVAVPIKKDGMTLSVLRLSVYMHHVEMLYKKIRIRIFQAGAIAFILATLVALFFSRSITLPIQHVRNGFKAVAEGNLETRVLLKNRDEIRDLADHFNIMVGRLHDLFFQVYTQEEQIQTIIKSLHEGFAVIDDSGKVVLANDSLKAIADNETIIGLVYWDVFRIPEFIELVKEVIATKNNGTAEIDFNGSILFVSASFLVAKSETVLIVHDITKIRQFERIKKDFVTNVSHELRTPLTAIKGYLETLEEESGNSKQAVHYIDIIKRHTERLIHIVKDLLMLSELENTQLRLNRTEVDINAVITQTMMLFERRAEEKNIILDMSLCHDGVIHADAFMLEQLIINLIDNAIKYTEKGHVRVCTARNGDFTIQVSDTGIGIPEHDHTRIFERFFVVDKSRSRRTGGTGLGLSIVKHIVQLHNGNVYVSSEVGKGTEFTVSLPIHHV